MYLSSDEERALLQPLLPQLAQHLGPEWRAEYDAAKYPRSGSLVADALSLSASIDSSEREPRLVVRPSLPALEGESYNGDLDKVRHLKARLSFSRPPASLAREIQRRVAEPYAAILPGILERHAKVRSTRASTRATAEDLAALFGTHLTERDIERLGQSSGGITLYARERHFGLRVEIASYGTYSFSLGTSDPSAALDIAAALVALKAEP